MKLPATISIGRVTRTHGADCFRIAVRDELSGIEVVDIEIDPHSFAMAIGNVGSQPCEVEWRPEQLGRKREHKTVTVPSPKVYVEGRKKRSEYARKHLAAFEVDGWRAYPDDLWNSHKSTRDGQLVVFERHVPATEADIAEARKENEERRRG